MRSSVVDEKEILIDGQIYFYLHDNSTTKHAIDYYQKLIEMNIPAQKQTSLVFTMLKCRLLFAQIQKSVGSTKNCPKQDSCGLIRTQD